MQIIWITNYFFLLLVGVTMVSKGLRLDLGTKVYRTVHFVHTGYAVDSTQSIKQV
jgi:hypothetical protein